MPKFGDKKFVVNGGVVEEVSREDELVYDKLPEEVRANNSLGSVTSSLNYDKDIKNDVKAELLNPTNPNVQDTLNRHVEYIKERDELVNSLKLEASDDPVLSEIVYDKAKEQVQDKEGLLQKAFRVLNYDTANVAGLTRGVINSVKGSETILDAFNNVYDFGMVEKIPVPVPLFSKEVIEGRKEGVEKNISFNDVLKEDLGWEGRNVLFVPKIKNSAFAEVLNPKNVFIPGKTILAIGEAIKNGGLGEFDGWQPIATDRGMAGFALDVALSPLTYVSFGTTPLTKAALLNGQTRKSVLRFANKALLYDDELKAGINAMKATKAGQAMMEALGQFAAIKIKGASVGDIATSGAQMFTSFGKNKVVKRKALDAEAKIIQEGGVIGEMVTKLFKPFSKEEKLDAFNKLFDAMKFEKGVKAGIDERVLAGKLTKLQGKNAKAAVARVRTGNPDMDKALDYIIGQTQKLAKEIGLEDEYAYTNYIPGILDETLDKGFGGGGKFQKLKKAGFFRQKKFKVEGMSNDIEKNFILRLQQMNSYKHVNNFIQDTLKSYGKKSEEFLKQGYDEFFPKGKLRFFRKTEEGALSVAKEKPTYLPKEVLASLKDFDGKITPDNAMGRALIEAWDDQTQLFKGWVTSVFPAFHFRNGVSNVMLRYLNEGWKAFKFKDNFDASKIMGKTFDDNIIEMGKGTKQFYTYKMIREAAEDRRIINSGQYADSTLFKDLSLLDNENIARTMTKDVVTDNFHSWLKKINPLDSQNNIILSKARKVGQMVEDNARMASFVRAVKDGYDFDTAADIVFSGLFDYADLTRFEKAVMKRLVPFYTFSRKNMGLQIKTLLTNPGRQANVFKFFNSLKDGAYDGMSEDQKVAFNQLQRDFMKKSFVVPMGFSAKDPNNVTFMMGFGVPQEEALSAFDFDNMAFKLNPALKVAYELGFKKFDKSIPLKNEYTAKQFMGLIKMFGGKDMDEQEFKDYVNSPGFQSNPLVKLFGVKATMVDKYEDGEKVRGEKELKLIMNDNAMIIMRNIFTARMLSVFGRYGNADETEEAAELQRLMTGISVIKHNMQTHKNIEMSKISSGIAEGMKKIGEGGDFSIKYGTEREGKRKFREVNRLKKQIKRGNV